MSYPLYTTSAQAAHAWGQNVHLDAPNVGLWWTRFYEGFTPDWQVETRSKKDFIERTAKWASQSGHARHAADLALRQKQLCESLGGATLLLETTGPMVTGSGISHPVENGFTFHPTLGLPYLPASGVKGLLRAWVEEWMTHESPEQRDALVREWFGHSGNGQDDKASAGSLVFFDALPAGAVSMGCDVMTPHMGKWYEKGDAIGNDNFGQVAPSDWHSPVPVPFLVVRKGVKFQWAIAPRQSGEPSTAARRQEAVKRALQELKNALEWVGAGAKTAVGYGRLVDVAAEEVQRAQASLQSSGIALGQEEWPAAKASWNKGKVELLVEQSGKKAVPLLQQKARDMRSQLKAEDIAKLEKGKPVTIRAIVDVKGNQAELVSIHSL